MVKIAVFGEESKDIDIFKGMVGTYNNNALSKVGCNIVENLILTREREYSLREDYIMILEFSRVPTAVPIATYAPPVNAVQNDIEVFAATGSFAADSPSLLICYDDATGQGVLWLNSNSAIATQISQTMNTANRAIKAFCQYKDRYYASNYNNTVFRVSNFSITGGATLIVTDLSSIVGINILVAFKNRIFGIAKNRIYYTDLPAVGGYPETWNTTINFFDMPSIDFDVTIYSAIIYKDKMYLFTDRGVYYFSANGDVLNWSVQLISAAYCVYNKNSACVNSGVIFLTNQNAVYAFNGSSFVEISSDIQEFFTESGDRTVFSVFAYEKGIALCRNGSNINSGNYTMAYNSGSPLNDWHFYYDMKIWVMLTGAVDPTRPHHMMSFIKAGINLAPFKTKIPASYMVYISDAISTYTITAMFIDKGKWQGDNYTLAHTVSANRMRKTFILQSPSVFLFEKKQIKLKKFILYMLWYDSATVSFNAGLWDGANNATPIFTIGDTVNTPTEYVIPITSGTGVWNQSQFTTHRAAFTMNGTIGKDQNNLEYNIPFIIYGLEVIYNSDNKQITEKVNG